ncbi:MAG: FtsX-like permease family protein [Chlorobiales bacterium]|jgi:putative ABC transport system permease protein|nr:FtsX-like permease family protein [Chlorobiales bacterium]
MKLPISYSYRNLLVRRTTTALTVLGIALVAFVYAAVLMLANGIRETLVATGLNENAIVVQRSSQSEVTSGITREVINVLMSIQGIEQGLDGWPLAVAETSVLINLPKRGAGDVVIVTTRGTTPNVLAVRKNIKIAEGRFFRPGTSEIIVGSATRKNFQNCTVGSTIKFAQRDWQVVGVFDAGRSGFDSEIWGDADQFMQAFRRDVFSSLTFRIPTDAALNAYKSEVERDNRLRIDVKREDVFYGEQSESLATFIRILGTIITAIFSIGAIIGAMITMYASVANRTREVGTLQAIGFPQSSVLLGFLLEALFLSVMGGIIGLIAASFLQMFSLSTMSFATMAEVEFRFSLTLDTVINVMIFSIVMGAIGGVLPAFRASRLKVVDALRGA